MLVQAQELNKDTGEEVRKWNNPTEAFYGARGRYKSVVMDDRCQLWDLETSNLRSIYDGVVKVHNPAVLTPGQDYPIPAITAPKESVLRDNYAYCVSRDKERFVHLDLSTGTIRTFDMPYLGYIVQHYSLDMDSVTVQAQYIHGGARGYMKLNFNSGTIEELSIIQQPSRQLVNLTPVGRV